MSRDRGQGRLAIVLHTHMPYVEGYGTWPFGEEWLWEAIVTSYLPVLDVLDDAYPAPVTLSLTPVLCDQLSAPGAIERCLTFLRTVRPASHALDLAAFREVGAGRLEAEIERSAAQYAAAADRLESLGAGGLLAALGRHATWTSSATHAVLPLLCTDDGIELQLRAGIDSHRRRFGRWAGGLWLPECGYAPWLDPLLVQAGVRATCVELTDRFGLGSPRHLRPLQTAEGPVLWPIDRAVIDLVWGVLGYPSGPAYRAYDRRTARDHRVWTSAGDPYDSERARALVREHARDFVTRVRTRLADGGVSVCALDTELLGHWWYEGVDWLGAVIEEADAAGLELTTLDDALAHAAPAPPLDDLGISSWGEGGDLRTWSAPRVADLAWQARTAELRVFGGAQPPSGRALRELLALQSSDWAFIAYRDWAGSYPRDRASGHAEALAHALSNGTTELDPSVRNLAPVL